MSESARPGGPPLRVAARLRGRRPPRPHRRSGRARRGNWRALAVGRLAAVVVLAMAAALGACEGTPGGDGDGLAREAEPGAAEQGRTSPAERAGAAGAEEAEGAEGAEGLPALAITIDDLPWVGPLPPGLDRLEGTARILAALEAHGAPATGFPNCARVQPGAPVLELWLEAGHALGNHTSRHLDLNTADPAAWSADARACDAFLRELTGESSLFFRYPYLHRGPTRERYRAGRETLDALGSTVAPVTINTGDWILDDAYVAALRAGDAAHARAIADAYLDHVVRAAAHYRQVAQARVGRDVPHVLLLHANALLADQLDALLGRLEGEGFRFLPLSAALEDPVYALEDAYIGPEGLSWLYRIPPPTPEAQAWDDAEGASLRRLIR